MTMSRQLAFYYRNRAGMRGYQDEYKNEVLRPIGYWGAVKRQWAAKPENKSYKSVYREFKRLSAINV